MSAFEAVRILIMFSLSFVVALFLTPFVFKFLQKFNLKKSNIRDEKSAPIFYQLHKDKTATPTMGGIIIWLTVLSLALAFWLGDKLINGFASYFNFVSRPETYLPLAALGLAALIGLIDDLWGILGKGPHAGGLDIKRKLFFYFLISLAGALWFYFRLDWDSVYIPFLGSFSLGFWYIPFFMFILMATAFSTNETDGLDGLAGGILFIGFAAFAAVAFILGRYDLAVMNAVILGALLAFLWFNIYPAKFFMGDTGSMSLGITLGFMAMLTNTVILLPLFAFILVIESLSVIIQVLSKKFRKKKIFLSAPIHHHFQALGWPETQVTMRFWIVSIIAAIFGLALFFLDHFA